jgi:hypothetical protein
MLKRRPLHFALILQLSSRNYSATVAVFPQHIVTPEFVLVLLTSPDRMQRPGKSANVNPDDCFWSKAKGNA